MKKLKKTFFATVLVISSMIFVSNLYSNNYHSNLKSNTPTYYSTSINITWNFGICCKHDNTGFNPPGEPQYAKTKVVYSTQNPNGTLRQHTWDFSVEKPKDLSSVYAGNHTLQNAQVFREKDKNFTDPLDQNLLVKQSWMGMVLYPNDFTNAVHLPENNGYGPVDSSIINFYKSAGYTDAVLKDGNKEGSKLDTNTKYPMKNNFWSYGLCPKQWFPKLGQQLYIVYLRVIPQMAKCTKKLSEQMNLTHGYLHIE